MPTTTAGAPVAVRDSLRLTDAWGVVSTIARTAAQMPPIVYRPQGDGRVRVTTGVGPELLRRPTPGMTPSAFVASAILSVALFGEVLIGKFRRAEQIVMLGILPPDAVEVSRDSMGEPHYRWHDGQRRHDLTRGDVAHGMLFSLDGLRGISPVRMCRDGLGLNRALAQQAAATAVNGGAPRGVLTVPAGPASDDVMAALKDHWTARHGGPENAGRVAVVTSEIDFKAVGMSLSDQEFLASRNFSTSEVCRIWGMPPWAIGASTGDSLRYENAESQALSLVKYCVASYLQPFEEAISADDDLCPGDQYCELLAEGVLRGDTKARYAAYETGLRAGFLTVDEVRRAESLAPLPAETVRQEVPVA